MELCSLDFNFTLIVNAQILHILLPQVKLSYN